MKSHRIVLAGCILLLLSSGCRSKKFFATPPDYNPETEAYIPKPSVVNLPISISMKAINTALNKELNGLVYEDLDYDNNNKDNLKVKIWRTKRDIRVDGFKEKIRIILPLEIWAAYRYEACSFCPVLEESTEFEMELTLNTLIRVGSDWQPLLTTSATDLKFNKEPQLDFGPVKIPITRIVKGALTSNLPSITANIDEEVSKNVPLKKSLTEAWEGLQEPILVDSSYKAWLVLAPQNIFVTPLTCDASKITLNAGISTLIRTHLGGKPKKTGVNPLTAPIIQDKIDNKFVMELPLSVDFDMATELARRNLKDSTFQLDKKKKITVRDIELYGKGGDVFIKTDLSGSFNGVIYLRGKPAIDTLTNKIYFDGLDFDINTKNALYKMAAWMAHGTLKKIMQKEFVYDLTHDLDGAVKSIQGYLDGYAYEDLLTVNGKVGRFRLRKIYCNEEEITAVFEASGTAAVQIDNLTMGSSRQ